MTLAKILGEVNEEVYRAIDLVTEGKLHRCVSSRTTTDIERASILTEEVSEVQDEAMMMLARMLELSKVAGNPIRSVNELESILFRWSAGPVTLIDKADWGFICCRREQLRAELIQVAAVAVAWINTLDNRIAADKAQRGEHG